MPKKEARILVVDDEPDVLELVVFHLKKEKYKVAIADNGDKALKIAKEQDPKQPNEAELKLLEDHVDARIEDILNSHGFASNNSQVLRSQCK